METTDNLSTLSKQDGNITNNVPGSTSQGNLPASQMKLRNAAEFLEAYNPSRQNYYCTQGGDRIYTGTAPMLKEVNEQYGYQTAMSWLYIQLNDMNTQLGYKWQMDTRQIEDCASLILERHGGLKVTELMAFFRGMKMGDYGEFYGSMNMNAVMMSLNKFYTVRNRQLENIYKKGDEEARKEREQKRKTSGLLAAEEYRNFLYDCKERGDGAQIIREYLIEHRVLVTDAEHPRGRYPTLEECEPDRLIAMAEERERMIEELAEGKAMKMNGLNGSNGANGRL